MSSPSKSSEVLIFLFLFLLYLLCVVLSNLYHWVLQPITKTLVFQPITIETSGEDIMSAECGRISYIILYMVENNTCLQSMHIVSSQVMLALLKLFDGICTDYMQTLCQSIRGT